jgi:hypothetical protein
MRKPKTKRLRMLVEVTCPDWLDPRDARREVRTLINEQAFYGRQASHQPAPARFLEIGAQNFRAVAVRPAGREGE